MNFRCDGTNTIAIFLSQKPESEWNKFSHFKIFRWLRRSLIFAWSFSLQIRVSEKDRENLHFFFTDRQNWNTLTRFLYQVFLIANWEKKSSTEAPVFRWFTFWRESKAMSRRKSIIVKCFSIECLQWIANLG